MQPIMMLAEGDFLGLSMLQWLGVLVLIGLIVLFVVMRKRG